MIGLTISLNLINLLGAVGRSLNYTKLNNTFMFNEGHLWNPSEIYEKWWLIVLKLTFKVLKYVSFFLYLYFFNLLRMKSNLITIYLKNIHKALIREAQLVGRHPTKWKVTAWFPVRARAWVAGSLPGRGVWKRQQIDVALSLFLPPFPSL